MSCPISTAHRLGLFEITVQQLVSRNGWIVLIWHPDDPRPDPVCHCATHDEAMEAAERWQQHFGERAVMREGAAWA